MADADSNEKLFLLFRSKLWRRKPSCFCPVRAARRGTDPYSMVLKVAGPGSAERKVNMDQ